MSYNKFHSRDLSVIGATKEKQLPCTLANPFVGNLDGADGEQGWVLLHGLWLKSSVDAKAV